MAGLHRQLAISSTEMQHALKRRHEFLLSFWGDKDAEWRVKKVYWALPIPRPLLKRGYKLDTWDGWYCMTADMADEDSERWEEIENSIRTNTFSEYRAPRWGTPEEEQREEEAVEKVLAAWDGGAESDTTQLVQEEEESSSEEEEEMEESQEVSLVPVL